MVPAQRGAYREQKAHPAPNAIDADLPETECRHASKGAQDLSLPAGWTTDRPAPSGLMRRQRLPADAQGLSLFGGHHGRVHPQGSGLADIEHAWGRVLPQALNEAIHRFGPPKIMTTDQGSQVTSFGRTDRLKRAMTKIPMDDKARYLDNICIERLWRSLRMRVSTRTPAKPGHKRGPVPDAGSPSPITCGPTQPMAVNRLPGLLQRSQK